MNNDPSSSSSSSSLPTTFFGLLLLHSSKCNNITLSEVFTDFATREFNAFLWYALIVTTTLLLRKLFKLLSLWQLARTLPGPPSPSFFAHHRYLVSRQNFTDVLSKFHEKYGPIVKLWLGPTQLLVSVKDPMLIQEMLTKAEDKLPFTGKVLHLAFGQSSLFAPSFEKAKKRRELLATELNERLLGTADLMPMKVADFIVDKIENTRVRGSIGCRLVSQHMAFTLMGATFFGDGFLAWPKAAMYEELLTMIGKDACFWASYNVTPFWKQGFWRYQRLCNKLRCLTQDMLQHCRKSCKIFGHTDENVHSESSNLDMKSADGAQCCSDNEFHNYYFSHDLNGHQNADDETCGNIMRVMFHGCQTTAALIANVLTNLVTHLELQDKVYSEISMIGRNPSKYKHEDVYRMPLLLATVYESARLLPIGPMLQRCSLKHDLSFASGVTIPAGAMLVVPVQLVQKDDSSWGSDACDFNPHRFLSNDTKGLGSAELNNPNENVAFLPFGSGTRACVGQKFVIQIVATLLASLLETYEIRLNSGSDDDPKPILKNHVLQHHPDSPILFVRRDQ
ncbi:geranylhydroquinone 3''-hydroxylase CYP76B74-like isoform X2 [Lotus japonicus]|uniref:geranylhydroquinone 3''-hydroxylase CYP76B74-like isoform X2 n=1 Tax=Lotus japonicus TaxID=34305 RepID=UPI00258345C6|nr:geranylhydroquinone 3''-hydroxylase CYP76B74-like isoform X2 [Lotus japonicus]